MKKMISAILIIFILSAAFTGCGSSQSARELTKTIKPSEIDIDPSRAADFSANSDFNSLFFSLISEAKTENPTVSPLSAYFALSMVQNGAKSDTLSAFIDLLGGESKLTNETCAALISSLTDTSGSTKLSVANSIWSSDRLTADKQFLQNIADYYSADMFSGDLTGVRSQVNDWVSDKTDGLIDSLLDSEPSEDTVMLLINTLYLDAKWQSPFLVSSTQAGWFYLESGSRASVDFMNAQLQTQKYISADNAEGVILPYDDGKLAFVALRPTDDSSVSEFAASIDGSVFKEYIAGATDKNMYFSMPKFSSETTFELNDMLSNAGLAIAFDPESADFTGLGTIDDGTNIFISNVLQKVKINVNEDGTTAAAATEVEMGTTSAPADEDAITLKLDSPFLYAVVDLESGAVLFTGIVDNPLA